MAVFALSLVLTGYLFAVIPKGFIPNEDTGQIFAFTEAAEDVSFDSLIRNQKAAAASVDTKSAISKINSAPSAAFTKC